jgi:hypothetical protein
MRIVMDNEDNEITLSNDKDITLMDNIRIKTADQDDGKPLRFYIYKSVSIESGEANRSTLKPVTEVAAVEEVSPVASGPMGGEVAEGEVEKVEEEIAERPSEEDSNGLPGFEIAFATCSLVATYLVLRKRD